MALVCGTCDDSLHRHKLSVNLVLYANVSAAAHWKYSLQLWTSSLWQMTSVLSVFHWLLSRGGWEISFLYVTRPRHPTPLATHAFKIIVWIFWLNLFVFPSHFPSEFSKRKKLELILCANLVLLFKTDATVLGLLIHVSLFLDLLEEYF